MIESTMNFTSLTREKMNAVVQVYVEGYFGEDVKSILNPRLGDLKEWTASGFFIDCPYDSDIIITNSHVVLNAKSIEVMSTLTSQERFKAEVIAMVKSQEPDVAILKLKDGEFQRFKKMAKMELVHLSIKVTDEVLRGTSIKAIGYPMGMNEPNITGGEITNFISGDRIVSEKYVTDAAINPGNSGGPAINESGEVVGVNTSIYEGADNIGFITPSNFIEIILENIFEKNTISFADIGGNFQKNSHAVAKNLKMEAANGIIVSSVDRGGFLEKAGIQKGDVLLSCNGDTIDRHGIFINTDSHRRNLFDVFKLFPIDQEVEFTVWRNEGLARIGGHTLPYAKKKVESKAVIEERFFLEVWGMTIQVLNFEIIEAYNLTDMQIFYQLLKDYDEYKERLVVTHLTREGDAYLQEWSTGEVISEFNGISIKSMDELIRLIDAYDGVAMIKSEVGTVGFFNCAIPEANLTLLSPSMYLE